MHTLLATLFNGLLFFSGTAHDHTEQKTTTDSEVATEQAIAAPASSMTNFIDLMYCTDSSMTIQVNFVVDDHYQLHVTSVESPMAGMNHLIKDKLEALVQEQSSCMPLNKEFSISLKLSYGVNKMS